MDKASWYNTQRLWIIGLIILLGTLLVFILVRPGHFEEMVSQGGDQKIKFWEAPDTTLIPKTKDGDRIRYGRDLIARTSYYLGPHGKVVQISNGMNCQNCHLEAGTKPFSNNYGSVASTYPKFRPRSGRVESIEKRINDCLERSLNGKALDSLSHEMRAMVAYIGWLGQQVPKGQKAEGSGLAPLNWMTRAADPAAGKVLYLQKCQICHGNQGEGLKISSDGFYIYPPLWGENSFNSGAGLYRISNFAKYIRINMPNGATIQKPFFQKLRPGTSLPML